MSETEITKLVADILGGIAPEADLSAVAGEADLRETLDLDSMDFLTLIVGLHERTGIDIPEADYPRLFTLDGIQAYFGPVAAKAPGG
jgi:acyl carrier protein